MLGYQACTIMADGGVAKQSEETPLNSRSAKLQEDNSKWTPWLVYTTIVIVIGSSLQFGYNTSCINAPEEVNEVAHTCRQYWPWFAWNLETIKAVWSWSFNVPMILGNQVNHGRIPNPFGGGLPRTIAFQNILHNVLSSCSNVELRDLFHVGFTRTVLTWAGFGCVYNRSRFPRSSKRFDVVLRCSQVHKRDKRIFDVCLHTARDLSFVVRFTPVCLFKITENGLQTTPTWRDFALYRTVYSLQGHNSNCFGIIFVQYMIIKSGAQKYMNNKLNTQCR